MKRQKLGNCKVYVGGEVYASKKEYRRWKELQLLQKAGEISDLQKQVKYVLIPTQYEPTGEYYKKGAKAGQPKMKVAERECSYIADFVYRQNGEVIVEDTKGCRSGATYEIFKIKRKLMLYKYRIKVREV